MTLLGTIFLYLHIGGAIVAFGPTIAFQLLGVRASKEPQQECFRLIVSRMPDGDEMCSEVDARTLEELVARGACRGLNRLPVASRPGRHGLTIDQNRAAERLGDRLAKLLVTVGGRPELMVEVCDAGEPQLAGRVELGE